MAHKKSRSAQVKAVYALLWYAVNLELLYGVAWVLLLVASGLWATPEVVSEVRLMGLHVLMPLTAVFAIEFVFKSGYVVSYMTRLSWIVPASVTVVTDLASLWLLHATWKHEGAALVSLLGANMLFGVVLAATALFMLGVLARTQYEHSTQYEAADAFDNGRGSAWTFESVVLALAVALAVGGAAAIAWFALAA